MEKFEYYIKEIHPSDFFNSEIDIIKNLKKKFKKLKYDYEDIPYFNSNSNKVKIPAAWLIETCGFKKIKFNNVSVHNNQSLVIVNLGEAQGIDIYKFSQKIKESVLKKFDILLEEEVNII